MKRLKLLVVSFIVLLCFSGALIAAEGKGPIRWQYWKLDSSGNLTTDETVVPTGPISALVIVSDHTASATLTAAQCVGYKHTNQGASAEVDLTMGAASQGAMVMFENQEAQVIEVGPPSGELIILDGTALDADDCVDSDGATIGSYMICSRGKIADGTATWICTSDGRWNDTGASD